MMKKAPVTTTDPLDLALAEAGDNRLPHRLIAQQIELVAAQLSEIRLKRLLWGGAVALMLGLLILLAIAMVNASRSRALIVEPFHVPASLEARGLDGAAIANRMIDRFAVMRDLSDSSRAEESYANGGDADIKIAIPNTGVSVGEVWRYLREWLGHDRRIGGDVTIVGDQVEVTARISGGKGASFRAPLADPTPAIEAAATSIFKQTQPYRHALLVGKAEGMEASIPLLRTIAEEGDNVRERQWGYVGWEVALTGLGRWDEGILRARQGIALDRSFGKIQSNLANDYSFLGRTEESLATNRLVRSLLLTPEQSQLSIAGFGHSRAFAERGIADAVRDDRAALHITEREGQLPEYSGNARFARMQTLAYLVGLGEYRRAAQAVPLLPFGDPVFANAAFGIAASLAKATGRPTRAVQFMERAFSFAPPPKGLTAADIYPTAVADYAEMLVAAGRVEDAARAIAPTRGDCYPCLVMRGKVAAAQGDVAGATRWFADAARQGPSLPQADYEWGRMLAANGNGSAALSHFAVAAKRGPNWYEPPYAAGRLLTAAHRFAEARAQIEQAHVAAPRRADVALALGRAQWLGGDRTAALANWGAARKLDLLGPDRAWLTRIDAAVRRAA